MNDVITLIKQTEETDDYGDPIISESKRNIFCGVSSVGQKEFYQAHATGLQPEIKFRIADYLDYEGEKLIEHNGQRYRVLRTYRNGQELELTCYQEVNPV